MTQGLQVEQTTLAYQGNPVVREVSLGIPAGRITALLGPNGSGKSTLMKGLANQLAPVSGRICLDGAPLQEFTVGELARRIAYLPQTLTQPEGFTVRELVTMGRYAYRRPFTPPSAEDRRAVDEAMTLADLDGIADRLLANLSGGQRQRAWIGLVLAQQTDILLLDEPTTYLDIAHQVELLELLRTLNTRQHKTIVLVLHDLNQALTYCDQVVMMKNGAVVSAGDSSRILNETTLSDVYEVPLRVLRSAGEGLPFVMPDTGRRQG